MRQNVAWLQTIAASQRSKLLLTPLIVTNYVMGFTQRQSLSSTKLELGTLTSAGITQSGAENLSPHVNGTDRHPHRLLKLGYFGK